MPKRTKNKGNKRPIPLAPSPTTKMSRKRARKVTTLFHKLTKERDEAVRQNDVEQIEACDAALEDMGGREQYQRASQTSTSFHSTSRWVLGYLRKEGWLIRGISINDDGEGGNEGGKTIDKFRPTRLLEIGAINTELVEAGEEMMNDQRRTKTSANDSDSSDGVGEDEGSKCDDSPASNNSFESGTIRRSNEDLASLDTATDTIPNHVLRKRHNLHVTAIDIHAMDSRIREVDFFDFRSPNQHFDVIVCSMVLNCVTTPERRGTMLCKAYHLLRPGGLMFFTVPLFCLTKSAFTTLTRFESLLGRTGVGFDIIDSKTSPRVAFFVCRRPTADASDAGSIGDSPFDNRWCKAPVLNRGKKFPNQFAVVLDREQVQDGVK